MVDKAFLIPQYFEGGFIMINLLGLIHMYNTYAPKDVYHDVAYRLIKNFDKLGKLNSDQIAELCSVSTSTLFRFFKMMDFPFTVSKLPEIMNQTKDNYLLEGNYLLENADDNLAPQVYLDKLISGFSNLKNLIDVNELNNLSKDILSCKKIIFVGYPIQSVWRFQLDLIIKGIENSAFLSPLQQLEELENIEEGSIAFFNLFIKPDYIPYKKELLRAKNKNCKIVVLSNNNFNPFLNIADYSFTFNGNKTEQDISIMNVYINIIAMNFVRNARLLSL